MGAAWIGDLSDVALLPTNRAGITRWYSNIGPLSFVLGRIHSKAPITLLDHRSVSLPICGKAHHPLRETHRQRFVLIGVPGVPCLPTTLADEADSPTDEWPESMKNCGQRKARC